VVYVLSAGSFSELLGSQDEIWRFERLAQVGRWQFNHAFVLAAKSTVA
jgi:hypothetical protein